MPTTVNLLSEPDYGNTLFLFVLSPPGVKYDHTDIGKNLYGKKGWSAESLLIPGLAKKNGFRFIDIPLLWHDFLALAFQSTDHALLFIPGKQSFHEVTKEHLLPQNPDMFSFSFYKFHCDTHRQEEAPVMAIGKLAEATHVLQSLLASGWSGAAISKVSGINQVTIGSIKNEKSSRISDKVYAKIMALKDTKNPAGTRTTKSTSVAAPMPAVKSEKSKKPGPKKKVAVPTSGSFINPNYVPVDIVQLRGVIDSLIAQFDGALQELQHIKKQIG
jgi:hypothetical protein